MNVESIIQLIYADKLLAKLREKIEAGLGTFKDTTDYCNRSAELLGRLFSENVLSMSDVERITANDTLLKDRYKDINDLLDKVQRTVDKKQGINIRPQHAPFNQERADQIGRALTDKTVSEETIQRRAGSAPATMTRAMQDDYVEENAKFRSDAGLKTYLVRVTDGDCCEWCTKVAGRYEYGTEPHDIYRRHDNCGCSVTYENGRQRQNVWTKKTWEVPVEDAGAPEPVRLTKEQAAAAGAPPPKVFSKEEAKKLEAEKIALNKSAYEERKTQISLNKVSSRSTERENDTFAEKSKIKSDDPKTIVNKHDIESPEYRKLFENFDESSKVKRIMYNESKTMLDHRTGTKYEDLTFIDSNTGDFITRNNFDKESQVEPTRRMYRMLRESEPHSIIAIHNHPKSGTPSIDDIGCAYSRQYKYGVIACHNGSLFRYSFLGEFDTSEENFEYVDMLLDNVNRIVYNKEKLANRFETKLADALNQLKEKNLKLEVFLWN